MGSTASEDWQTCQQNQQELFENLAEEFARNQENYNRTLDLSEKMRTVQVGKTPRERIWRRNKASLYRYHLPEETGNLQIEEQTKPRLPLLIVYALINKPYVLDLRPGNSFIAFMLQKGFDVYLLDWGTPSDEDANLKIENYILDYMPQAIKKMRQATGLKEYSMLGYCMGGTLAVIFTAAFQDDPPANLILLAAPIDFSKPNTLSLWLQEKYFNVDNMVDTLGMVPAELIDFGSKMLKPFQNFVQNYLDLHGKLWDDKYIDSWAAMNKWVNDGVPVPGEVYRQWVKDFYRQNKLMTGALELRNREISLDKIKAALLNVIAERDHIVPPEMSSSLMGKVSSEDKTQYIIPAGHVGMVAGRGAANQLWPFIANWLAQRSK